MVKTCLLIDVAARQLERVDVFCCLNVDSLFFLVVTSRPNCSELQSALRIHHVFVRRLELGDDLWSHDLCLRLDHSFFELLLINLYSQI